MAWLVMMVRGQRLCSIINPSRSPRSASFCISVPQLGGPSKVSKVDGRDQGKGVQRKSQFPSNDGNRRNRQERREKPRKNPFYSNVGASRQLRSLGLDVDDPELNKQDFLYEQSLESRMEESKAFRKQWKVDEAELKELAKRKIVQKKMFPKPANPSLLTWLEKETIRSLHRQDPVEWNHQRLAESFPATPGVIHKVLRGKTITSPERIAEYNKAVTSNWKLLAKGKLELEASYQRHLASSSGAELPLTQRLLAEQDAVGFILLCSLL